MKALLQRSLRHLPGGRWANDRLLTCLGWRKPMSVIVEKHRASLARNLSLLADADFAVRPGFRALELGTGKHLTPATLLALHGVAVTTVDVTPACQWPLVRSAIRHMAAHPESVRLPGAAVDGQLERRLHELASTGSLADYCEVAQIRYVAPYSLTALREGDYGRFDLCFSVDVLEHVPPALLADLLEAIRASAGPAAAGVHWVDFRDHFNMGFLADRKRSYLNYRRFGAAHWARFVREGDFSYVNRLMPSDIERAMRESGFEVAARHVDRWGPDVLPIPIDEIDPAFRDGYDPEELRVLYVGYCLRKQTGA
ncbi:MAG: hypothetical protein FJX75_21165 [Armatimonadetes bacterium]|nr:hypothetical protein [Armatimonadota bacterium]